MAIYAGKTHGNINIVGYIKKNKPKPIVFFCNQKGKYIIVPSKLILKSNIIGNTMSQAQLISPINAAAPNTP